MASQLKEKPTRVQGEPPKPHEGLQGEAPRLQDPKDLPDGGEYVVPGDHERPDVSPVQLLQHSAARLLQSESLSRFLEVS